MRRGALLLAGALVVGAVGCSGEDEPSSTAGSAPPGSAGASTFEDCAWKTRADAETLNIAYPDTAATYWALTYSLAPGETLELAGRYPDARYASFVTYGFNGGAVDVLTDVDIAPDDGGTNPFTPEAGGDGVGDGYTVTVRGDVGPTDDPNAIGARRVDADVEAGASGTTPPTTLPDEDPTAVVLGTGGSTADATIGTMLYRVYLSNDPDDPTGGAGLPAVTVVGAGGERTPVPECPDPGPSQRAIDIVNSFERPGTTTPATPIFIRPQPNAINLFPNPDNVYVATVVAHQPGRVVVVRGRAPTFPDTRGGDGVTGDEQLRFWSMCTNELRKPYPVTDCASDVETALDDDGRFTYVISTPEDRPAETPATEGSTWLDWGSTEVDTLLLLRHMLAADNFAEAATNLEPGTLATARMGEYAPVGAYCDKATFEQGGWQACGL